MTKFLCKNLFVERKEASRMATLERMKAKGFTAETKIPRETPSFRGPDYYHVYFWKKSERPPFYVTVKIDMEKTDTGVNFSDKYSSDEGIASISSNFSLEGIGGNRAKLIAAAFPRLDVFDDLGIGGILNVGMWADGGCSKIVVSLEDYADFAVKAVEYVASVVNQSVHPSRGHPYRNGLIIDRGAIAQHALNVLLAQWNGWYSGYPKETFGELRDELDAIEPEMATLIFGPPHKMPDKRIIDMFDRSILRKRTDFDGLRRELDNVMPGAAAAVLGELDERINTAAHELRGNLALKDAMRYFAPKEEHG